MTTVSGQDRQVENERLTLVQDAGRWGRYTQSYCDATYVGKAFPLQLGKRRLLVRTLSARVPEDGRQVVLVVEVLLSFGNANDPPQLPKE